MLKSFSWPDFTHLTLSFMKLTLVVQCCSYTASTQVFLKFLRWKQWFNTVKFQIEAHSYKSSQVPKKDLSWSQWKVFWCRILKENDTNCLNSSWSPHSCGCVITCVMSLCCRRLKAESWHCVLLTSSLGERPPEPTQTVQSFGLTGCPSPIREKKKAGMHSLLLLSI